MHGRPIFSYYWALLTFIYDYDYFRLAFNIGLLLFPPVAALGRWSGTKTPALTYSTCGVLVANPVSFMGSIIGALTNA